MKVIVAGSRSIEDISVVRLAIEASGFEITELVSGGAIGVDSLAEKWARNKKIPVKQFKPQYNKFHAKVAPVLRNTSMAEYAEALIAVRKVGKSNGTDDMIEKAKARNLKIFILIIGE